MSGKLGGEELNPFPNPHPGPLPSREKVARPTRERVARPMLRSLTVLITREEERALIVLARDVGITPDEFISMAIRRTCAAYCARAKAMADQVEEKLPVILDHEITDVVEETNPHPNPLPGMEREMEQIHE